MTKNSIGAIRLALPYDNWQRIGPVLFTITPSPTARPIWNTVWDVYTPQNRYVASVSLAKDYSLLPVPGDTPTRWIATMRNSQRDLLGAITGEWQLLNNKQKPINPSDYEADYYWSLGVIGCKLLTNIPLNVFAPEGVNKVDIHILRLIGDILWNTEQSYIRSVYQATPQPDSLE